MAKLRNDVVNIELVNKYSTVYGNVKVVLMSHGSDCYSNLFFKHTLKQTTKNQNKTKLTLEMILL